MAKLDTSIDRLVEYVKLRKSCSVDDAAKSLGLPSKQVEELSEILAESGLIDVRYEFSGIRLFPKMVKKEVDDLKLDKDKKFNIYDRIENIRKELMDAENMFVFSEKDIRRKVENAKAHFREIEKLDLSSENPGAVKSKIADLDSSIKVFEEKIDSLEKSALDMRKEVDAFEEQLDKQKSQKSLLKIHNPFAGIFRKVKERIKHRRERRIGIEKPGLQIGEQKVG